MAATAVFHKDAGRVDYTPGSAVAAGAVVVLNTLIGVATTAIAANEKGSLATEGIFYVPKLTGSSKAIAAGKKVYWDVADQEVKEDSESAANPFFGKTVVASGDNDTHTYVQLINA